MFEPHLHYDIDIESAILGSVLIDKHAFARVRGILTKECFYKDENQLVFDVISEMWEDGFPIDILTVISKICRNRGVKDFNGVLVSYYVTKLTMPIVNTANLEAHALIIRQLYAERELWKIRHSKDDVGGDVV